jgi:hypothetical protein
MNFQAISIILLLFGLILAAIGLRNLFRARFWAAGSGLMAGGIFLAAASVLFLIASNLHTYARLTYEAPVAELQFEASGPQRYQATLLRLPAGERQTFTVNGDEWQLDARVLKWQGWANVLGLDAQYRLERISGRYRDIEQERNGDRSVYPLSDNPGWDLWTWTIDNPGRLPFVDAVYGSATYLPMADGARYRVTISQTGLLARPMNTAAETAAKSWMQ